MAIVEGVLIGTAGSFLTAVLKKAARGVKDLFSENECSALLGEAFELKSYCPWRGI